MSLTVFHYPILLALPKLFTLHSVLERSGKETCRKVVEDYVKVVSTYGEVVGDEEVDVVIVSTPNNTHYEYVKKALEHGKHGESPYTIIDADGI
jgi:scyllo-inositol 2-dehydrogenase (NADP+)